jgi:hypothetical protein
MNDWVSLFIIFQENPDGISTILIYFLEVLDISLGLQDLYDLKLKLGGRDIDFFVPSHTGIPDLGQHIRNGIRNAHPILLPYQLDFVTPGISPSLASLRKQRRHISNFRRYPRGRPQIRHLLTFLVEYFGVFNAFKIIAFLAMGPSLIS